MIAHAIIPVQEAEAGGGLSARLPGLHTEIYLKTKQIREGLLSQGI